MLGYKCAEHLALYTKMQVLLLGFVIGLVSAAPSACANKGKNAVAFYNQSWSRFRSKTIITLSVLAWRYGKLCDKKDSNLIIKARHSKLVNHLNKFQNL